MKTVAAVLSAAIVVSAGSAFACGNSMRFRERAENLVAKAGASYREGRYADAVQYAELGMKGSVSDGDRRALLRTHGLASLKLGHFSQSTDSFTQLLSEKKEPFVQVKLAESQLRSRELKGEVDGAAKAALEKLASDGLLADADAWTALANARAKSGDVDGARAACDEALKVHPGHPEATQVLTTLSVPKSGGPVKPSSKS